MSGITLAEYDPTADRQQLHALIKAEGEARAELSERLQLGCPGIVLSSDPEQGLLLATFPEAGDRGFFLQTLVAALDIYAGTPTGTAPELLETRMVAVPDANVSAPRFSRHFRLHTEPVTVLPAEPCLVLEHGTSFGSGRHPSTRLAMAALDRLADHGSAFPARVLDVGCGSGILALAAGLLGAREVLGIDVDAGALAVAARNALGNQLADRVCFAGQTLIELSGPCDLLVANVTGAVMSGMVADFARLLGPAGWLVISGLQGRQLEEMVGIFGGLGFVIIEQFSEEPWRAALLRGARAQL